MPNREQVVLLLKGVQGWNDWQQYHQDVEIDLTGADLSANNFPKAELRWANMTGANLKWTNLQKAYLVQAILVEADLTEVNLTEANLTRADLSIAVLNRSKLIDAILTYAILVEADLTEADLTKANLTGADLSEADLTDANLNKANLSTAQLYATDLTRADLSGANLTRADLSYADLSEANLTGADLSYANLTGAELKWANLTGTNLTEAILTEANLTAANLTDANLTETKLIAANLTETKLIGAKLIKTQMLQAALLRTNLKNATLEDCSIYGISAWDVDLEGTIQRNLNILPLGEGEGKLTVENLKVAQFIHLLLNNAEIRDVIDTVGKKAVLILGRFTSDGKAVLDAIKNRLAEHGYVPILFDFTKPDNRDLTETVITLASLSRFVIADLTNPSSIPHELMSFVEKLPSVAVQPIILKEHFEYGMFEHLRRYQWVLPIHKYESQDSLIQELSGKVIEPAEQKAIEQKPPNSKDNSE